jgi:hypothetical protein
MTESLQAVVTETSPDMEARQDPRHAVLAGALRRPNDVIEVETVRVWGRSVEDYAIGLEGNSWAGTPEDVADVLVRALQAAEGTLTPPVNGDG